MLHLYITEKLLYIRDPWGHSNLSIWGTRVTMINSRTNRTSALFVSRTKSEINARTNRTSALFVSRTKSETNNCEQRKSIESAIVSYIVRAHLSRSDEIVVAGRA
jgi:hypothetical protein